jgi:TPP-dependent pyruvate/acetoin dehydrogenase alpha subunit
MSGMNRTESAASTFTGAPMTRPQREELLRILLLGRGLERMLADRVDRGHRMAPSESKAESVLAAIAAAAGLDPGDRLIVPHGLLAAHLASGIGPREIAAARFGGRPARSADASRRLRPAVGDHSPAAIAVGAAFALRRSGRSDAAVALTDRRWAEEPDCRCALALARELDLPLVVVAIDTGAAHESSAPVVDRGDFEAIRSAVGGAIETAHADGGPSLVVCAPSPHEESRNTGHVARFATRVEDPITTYERWLMIHGFSRAEIEQLRHAAAAELEEALGEPVDAGSEDE